MDPYTTEKFKNADISFSYLFEKDLTRFLKVEIKDKSFGLSFKDIIDDPEGIKLSPPIMFGEYGMKK